MTTSSVDPMSECLLRVAKNLRTVNEGHIEPELLYQNKDRVAPNLLDR